MKYIVLIYLLFATVCNAQEIQYFNTGIFGNKSTDSIQVLLEAPKDAVTPFVVLLDVKNGVYYASTVHYPKILDLEQIRDGLNKNYKQYEKENFANNPDMGLWRNEDSGFSVQLSENDESVQVIYISFAQMTEQDFWEAFEKAQRLYKEE